MADDLYRAPALYAEAEHVDDALVQVRIYVERGGQRRSAGYAEMSPSVWRHVRHALSLGLSMTGSRLDVADSPARRTHDDLRIT